MGPIAEGHVTGWQPGLRADLRRPWNVALWLESLHEIVKVTKPFTPADLRSCSRVTRVLGQGNCASHTAVTGVCALSMGSTVACV